MELTLEQQFELAKIRSNVDNLTVSELRILLVDLYELMLKKDNMAQKLIAHQWGIDFDCNSKHSTGT